MKWLHPMTQLQQYVATMVFAVASVCSPLHADDRSSPSATAIHHVFLIMLENEPFDITFGAQTSSPYLSHELTAQGALLTQYYGIGHNSLGNYIALISGQAPNPATQKDCQNFVNFHPTARQLDANGQLAGQGCVYPSSVKTVTDQMRDAGLSWKGYMEGMGNNPRREAPRCGHAAIGAVDQTYRETLTDRYADKHNPFVYFHSIIDDKAYCSQHIVPLDALRSDLQQPGTTPNLAFITPDLCHDGHDAPCLNGETGGPISADAFLRDWVPRIMASPAFRKDGVLIITFDEGTDASACCGEEPLGGGPPPGQYGPGGGRIGAVVLSPFVKPGTVSHTPYNHYATLRSMETWFGLDYLGYAAQPLVHAFGEDVFTRPPGSD
ncbi:alkaline phosphatase family protein [Dyella sp. EPa41]|uniref:alkaline phosphatase family protein n=1 Tax=Dyella sp. EPa41 TaxID=1561194 RepID=UPI001F2D5A6F|nr:alkaline phosphatase family protein [Dyella sp. EPa41]